MTVMKYSDYPTELCSILQRCNFLCTCCTCGPWVNVGEVLLALQFDFIKDVHLLLCRERAIKPHLWSTTNKIRSMSPCLCVCESPFVFGVSITFGTSFFSYTTCCGPGPTFVATSTRKVVTMKTMAESKRNNILLHIQHSDL